MTLQHIKRSETLWVAFSLKYGGGLDHTRKMKSETPPPGGTPPGVPPGDPRGTPGGPPKTTPGGTPGGPPKTAVLGGPGGTPGGPPKTTPRDPLPPYQRLIKKK